MKIKSLLLTLIFIVSVAVPVNAQEQFETSENVPVDKVWTVKFNTEIDPSSIKDDMIYYTYRGGYVPAVVFPPEKVEVNGDTLKIHPPEEGLRASEDYRLYVLPLESTSGVTMENKFTHDFTTAPAKKDQLKVHFIDVGQGDSILVEFTNGKTMLVDGGDKSAGEKVVSYLKKAGISTIDKVVATHPDADHIGGLIDVMKKLEVKSVLDSGKSHTTETYEEYLDIIDQKDIPFDLATRDSNLRMDPLTDVKVLHVDKESSDNNASSIVLKVTRGNIDFMLMGDAEAEDEIEIAKPYDVEAEILKVSHHGSDTGSAPSFIDEVSPEVGVLSYGADNNYGHPTDEVVRRLKEAGAELYSTAEAGDIVVKTNGETYDVEAQPFNPDVEPNPKPSPSVINIVNVGLDSEIVTIENTNDTSANLGDWKLLSVTGNQTYTFPSDYTLAAEEKVYVTSGRDAVSNPPSYLEWTGAYIWNNDGDSAKLFDDDGNLKAEWQ
ncbi:MBL fold metallo-hydrolase [Pontibacillus yanchengensis]|uniref:MBL fold metallo-hydrolase n=2 Tax=Pontibacillus yanchengensis TaxID=462910 RepID=A0A6I4ZZB2_9BACI|nr:MBL fold metallo-hydrolase [Pontibacillus yanchengensis]MYL34306.1 MBL fold metallo-hydrolase [Pontibacillus yanchengensis]MYL53774.1 MBL fold metallo-hydrolase [Pontibacillus yanchengensis]